MATSSFHPTVQAWFRERFEGPTGPQAQGWPLIASGRNVLIAAPTGSGKTLTAFLHAIDTLLRQGEKLGDGTQVLYVSPLKALGNDIQKNLRGPLDELTELDPHLPEIRVLVRSGDTTTSERTAMTKRPPHILVTTPESLYILLTSDGGRNMLKTVRTVIVDEIHAVAGSKRGSHLSLSLERLEALAGPVQRIGLSATQKPIENTARFLVGEGHDVQLVDTGHLRELDIKLEIPPSPLAAVCSHETWEEIYARMSELIQEHRTTLVFVNTRKLAERVSAQLSKILGEDVVGCHHGSLSKDRRLEAEEKLKAGELRALVATASLELGIDIGDVDLVIQCGSTRAIATFLQRVGRAGHGVGRIPKGRLFPMTQDELVEATALVLAVDRGELDKTVQPRKPLDILSQQIIAACVPETWSEDELYTRLSTATPYRDLQREEFDSIVQLHAEGRLALLHRDRINGNVRGTRRARMVAIMGGGAIPDNADYRVLQEPEGTYVGSINEDFAIESSVGDIFQLGNTSWQVMRVEPGVMRVADAHGAPPNLPFWLGEAPARTRELSREWANLREDASEDRGVFVDDDQRHRYFVEGALQQIHDYVHEGVRVLSTVPTQKRVVLERFFDETGGMQLVLHAPFGGRINRAWGLALRKKFCRSFGFELQAAANEEAIVLSLGPQHSFPLAEVFDYLHPDRARDDLIQALLPTPMFQTRWRWNVTRSLAVPRSQGGKRVPPPLLRMRADDYLIGAFPQVMACGETLPPGDIPVPMEHPLVRQTIEDCLNEAMDVDGFLRVLRDMRDGAIEKVAVDTSEPSAFASSILNAAPYAFLDDAPLEERRTQAVQQRRHLDPKQADEIGALDRAAVDRVREEAWPDPRDAEEVHEALLWMGYVATDEADEWMPWLEELRDASRVVEEDGKWFAAEVDRDPLSLLRGRMEALGPVVSDDPLLAQLETAGEVLQARLNGQEAWCNRRLLARIHRYTLEALRREIRPVSAGEYLRFLGCWQHVDPEFRVDGPRGVAEVVAQLAGFDAPAAAWEREILPARVKNYRQSWLDELTMSGEVMWGRLWGQGNSAPRATPICMVPRSETMEWLGLAGRANEEELSGYGRPLLDMLRERGAMFPQELMLELGQMPEHFERGLAELMAQGLLTCDSYMGMRQFLVPQSKRRHRVHTVGRWSPFRVHDVQPPDPEFVATLLLRRYGVVFHRMLKREKLPVHWRDLLRTYRRLELRGDVRGGRFVEGFSGEQFALPEAVALLRKLRRQGDRPPVAVAREDPLSLDGVLTPTSPVAHLQTATGS